MSSQTSSVAQQVRIQQWADLIRDCQNRPCEMTLDAWCLLHGINKATYYYRLRKVRQACLNVMTQTKPVFVELSLPDTTIPDRLAENNSSQPIAILHGKNGLTLQLLPTVSSELVDAVLKVMSHAE